MIKIIRKWEGKQFDYGQDMKGNVFCKCKKCDKTGVVYRTLNVDKRRLEMFAKCSQCGTRKRIDDMEHAYKSRL
jgi:RNase P subunit RPR2